MLRTGPICCAHCFLRCANSATTKSSNAQRVDVPRSWLRRSSRKRVWSTLRDIPTERIKRVLCFSELAGASLED
jgi:hypothetical protein